MKEILQQVADDYDLVVIDTAPVQVVADATVIAQQVDSVLIVADTTRVRRAQLAATIEALERTGAHVAGIVLNRVKPRPHDDYYYVHDEAEEAPSAPFPRRHAKASSAGRPTPRRPLSPSRNDRLVVAVTGRYHGLGNRTRVVLGAQALARFKGRSFRVRLADGAGVRGSARRALGVPMRADSRRWRCRARSSRRTPTGTPASAGSARRPGKNASGRSEPRTPLPSRPAHPPGRRRSSPRSPWSGSAVRILELSAASADRPYLGVMIRAHAVAHDATLRESPVEWYLDRIEEIRSEQPELGLYISADTDDAFVRVARRFPDCVGQTDKGGLQR